MRRPPYRHPVRSHWRRGFRVKSYERGKGARVRPRRVVGSRGTVFDRSPDTIHTFEGVGEKIKSKIGVKYKFPDGSIAHYSRAPKAGKKIHRSIPGITQRVTPKSSEIKQTINVSTGERGYSTLVWLYPGRTERITASTLKEVQEKGQKRLQETIPQRAGYKSKFTKKDKEPILDASERPTKSPIEALETPIKTPPEQSVVIPTKSPIKEPETPIKTQMVEPLVTIPSEKEPDTIQTFDRVGTPIRSDVDYKYQFPDGTVAHYSPSPNTNKKTPRAKRKFGGRTYQLISTHPSRENAERWGKIEKKNKRAKSYRVSSFESYTGTRYALWIRKN